MSEPVSLFSYRQLGRVVLLRLKRTAETRAEVETFATLIEAAHGAARQPLIIVNVSHNHLTRPSDEIRALIFQRVKERIARGHIELAILVMPTGNLFMRALIRSFFTGARLMMGLRQQLRLADDLADAAREIEARCGIKASDVIKAAQEISDPK